MAHRSKLEWWIKTSGIVFWIADHWDWFNERFSIIEPDEDEQDGMRSRFERGGGRLLFEEWECWNSL